jgi:hypothetical protein
LLDLHARFGIASPFSLAGGWSRVINAAFRKRRVYVPDRPVATAFIFEHARRHYLTTANGFISLGDSALVIITVDAPPNNFREERVARAQVTVAHEDTLRLCQPGLERDFLDGNDRTFRRPSVGFQLVDDCADLVTEDVVGRVVQ